MTAKMTEETCRELFYDDRNGICLSCGEIQMGSVEPDAEGYECGECGERKVCGIAQALLLDQLTIVSSPAQNVPSSRLS